MLGFPVCESRVIRVKFNGDGQVFSAWIALWNSHVSLSQTLTCSAALLYCLQTTESRSRDRVLSKVIFIQNKASCSPPLLCCNPSCHSLGAAFPSPAPLPLRQCLSPAWRWSASVSLHYSRGDWCKLTDFIFINSSRVKCI